MQNNTTSKSSEITSTYVIHTRVNFVRINIIKIIVFSLSLPTSINNFYIDNHVVRSFKLQQRGLVLPSAAPKPHHNPH